jgi:hypothetical protein
VHVTSRRSDVGLLARVQEFVAALNPYSTNVASHVLTGGSGTGCCGLHKAKIGRPACGRPKRTPRKSVLVGRVLATALARSDQCPTLMVPSEPAVDRTIARRRARCPVLTVIGSSGTLKTASRCMRAYGDSKRSPTLVVPGHAEPSSTRFPE